MDWIKTLAPLLGSAIAGPLGGAAASFIADKLGIPADSVKDVLSSATMTPDQISQLKLAEIEFKKFLDTNKIKLAELDQKDRQGARDMAVATHSLTPSILTWIIVVLTLAAEAALLFNAMPPGADPIIVGRVLGTMDAALMLVLGFWFGSSSGSQKKDLLLAGVG